MTTSDQLSSTIQLACELIRRRSITPADEGCQDLLINRLRALDFSVTDLPFGEVNNFWAVRGNEGPLFVFAGHTDVVPTGSETQWRYPPFSPTIDQGFLYGRGAADMKGSLAAMVTACEKFIGKYPNHRGRIGFLITSDEEGIATHGTKKVVDWLESQNEKIDWCLVGEPSSTAQVGDVIKNGRRGSLGGELTVTGIQGHVAYPHLAKNPIHTIAPVLAELIAETWDNGNAFFPATSFQISNFNSGTGATNVIPEIAKIIFNFRFSTEVTANQLQQRTEAILQKHGVQYDLHWHLSGQPFLTANGELVKAAISSIEKNTGLKTALSTAGGTSDGRFIAPTGAQVLELGPVNGTIHQINECVSVEDLDKLSQIYHDILVNLLTS